MNLRIILILEADMKEYKTDNKRVVTDFFLNNKDSHFTIDKAHEKLLEGGIDIPKSSLYRIVRNLHRAGTLRRFEAQGVDSFVYQYANFSSSCEMHFHLKCTECGKLIHLECEEMNRMKEHIMKEHGFLIGGEGIISGICLDCAKK